MAAAKVFARRVVVITDVFGFFAMTSWVAYVAVDAAYALGSLSGGSLLGGSLSGGSLSER